MCVKLPARPLIDTVVIKPTTEALALLKAMEMLKTFGVTKVQNLPEENIIHTREGVFYDTGTGYYIPLKDASTEVPDIEGMLLKGDK